LFVFSGAQEGVAVSDLFDAYIFMLVAKYVELASNITTLQPYNIATFQHYNFPTLQHFNIPTLNLSNF